MFGANAFAWIYPAQGAPLYGPAPPIGIVQGPLAEALSIALPTPILDKHNVRLLEQILLTTRRIKLLLDGGDDNAS